jgi:hypothetical protein
MTNLHIEAVHGGQLSLPAAKRPGQLGLQFHIATCVSMVLKGQQVCLRHWLPGLDLYVQAQFSLEGLPGWHFHEDWARIHARLTGWMDQPADEAELDLSVPHVSANLITSPAVPAFGDVPVAFTVICEWAVPGADRNTGVHRSSVG